VVVLRHRLFVRIHEHGVETRCEARQDLPSVSLQQFDLVGDAGVGKRLAGGVRMLRVALDGESLPSSGSTRASQTPLYPPSVPSSNTRRAPTARSSTDNNFPSSGEI
jgi:hypothetical protein